jgi:hypothetical protein
MSCKITLVVKTLLWEGFPGLLNSPCPKPSIKVLDRVLYLQTGLILETTLSPSYLPYLPTP